MTKALFTKAAVAKALSHLIVGEKQNLEAHKKNPGSACAGWHRGAICAYENIKERLDWQWKERK